MVVPAHAAADQLQWKPCHEIAQGWVENEFTQNDRVSECAPLEVPLNYDDPSSPKIKLAVSRIKATDQKNRRGALVINPGGPGGSGISEPFNVSKSLMGDVGKVYDLIGFDPRGVQYSDKISCRELAEVFMQDPPSPPLERKDWAENSSERHSEAAKACAAKNPDFARSLTTRTIAKDVDSIREALGEKKISFFGKSWGTALGALYRSMFDSHVDRMLLDSVVAPGQSIGRPEDVAAAQHKRALATTSSPSGRSMRTSPPGEPELTGSDELGDQFFMQTAVDCNDSREGRDFKAVWKLAMKIERAYPQAPAFAADTFGFDHIGRCVGWPLPAKPLPGLTAGSSELQLVGHAHETTTPIKWAKEMQRKIGGSLLTVQDDQHVSLQRIPCATKAVEFFVKGRQSNCVCH